MFVQRWIRVAPLGLLVLFVSLVNFGSCGSIPCKDGYSSGTINTNGRACDNNCQCNNQGYEGYCAPAGSCVSVKRISCERQGAERNCIVEKQFQGIISCQKGSQVCKEQGLQERVWGNCTCDNAGKESVSEKPEGEEPASPEPAKEQGPEAGPELGPEPVNDAGGQDDTTQVESVPEKPADTSTSEKEGPEKTEGCKSNQDCPAAKPNCQAGVCVRLCDKNDLCKDNEQCKQGFCQPCPDGGSRTSTETCDGKDNDCNGSVDDNFQEKGKACSVPQKQGLCTDGTYTACTQGKLECTGPKPVDEVCNGKDDDCNGQIDDKVKSLGQACTVPNVQGHCSAGVYSACVAGKLECDAPKPVVERCDGLDNDCDGTVDNKAVCPLGGSCVKGACVATCLDKKTCVRIPAGSFFMGSPTNEPNRGSDETLHKVTLTHPFLMWKTEVTQTQFQTTMGYNPSKFGSCGGNCPVEQVWWHEAAKFANAKSQAEGLPECYDCTGTKTGSPALTCKLKAAYTGNNNKDYYRCMGWRLPTEAEWEYAARGGTTTPLYGSLSDISWYNLNAKGTSQETAKKQPNAWGLFDMIGNVSEWTWDAYGAYGSASVTNPVGPTSGKKRVNRGSDWASESKWHRAATRNSRDADNSVNYVGFRIVRSLCPAGHRWHKGTCQDECSISGTCITVQPGTFTMGSPTSEQGRQPDEGPQTSVTLSRSMLVWKTEVTQKQFESSMGYNPSFFKACGGECPVEQVNWHEAAAFANALSYQYGLTPCFQCSKIGKQVTCKVASAKEYSTCRGWRLPTEAEWEFIARAGSTQAQYGALSSIAWTAKNSKVSYSSGLACKSLPGGTLTTGNCGTNKAGTKQANAWKIVDALGNVDEWVFDWYLNSYSGQAQLNPTGPATGAQRVVRGGSYRSLDAQVRAAVRGKQTVTDRLSSLGFRVVRTPCRIGEVYQDGRCIAKCLKDNTCARIPKGTFTMGTPSNETDRDSDETQHQVTLSRPFLMMTGEVTQGDFQALMKSNPSYFTACGGKCPVEQVNWHDAAAYANALSRSLGLPECYQCSPNGTTYTCSVRQEYTGNNGADFTTCMGWRLPTEAEWEHAGRAGSSAPQYGALKDIAWYNLNCKVSYKSTVPHACKSVSGNQQGTNDPSCECGTHPVKTKTPNQWGLYDMIGNVGEWTHDWYGSYSSSKVTDPVGSQTGKNRTVRGGHWTNSTRLLRVGGRSFGAPVSGTSFNLGFRLVRTTQ